MQKPILYMMIGYPGSGKTTTARVIQQLTGAVHIWADYERMVMFEKPTHSQEESQQLYERLNKLTGRYLSEGKSVIFDTNFNYRKDRQKLRLLAAQSNATSQLVWVKTPAEIAHQRATEDAHKQETRVLGNMKTEDFHRIKDHLEPPTDEEDYVEVDGTKVTEEYIRNLLLGAGVSI